MCPPSKRTKYDSTEAEANDRLKLTKDEVGGYINYYNQTQGRRQTIDEWAKEKKRGVYAEEGNTPEALLGNAPLAEGETNTAFKGTADKPKPLEADLADKLQRSTRIRATGRGLKSTFLTGAAGDTSVKPLSEKPLTAPKKFKTLLGAYEIK